MTKKHNVKEISDDYVKEADETTIKLEEEDFSEVMCHIPNCNVITACTIRGRVKMNII